MEMILNQANSKLNKIIYLAQVLTTKMEEWIVDKIDNQVTTLTEYIGWGIGSGTIDKGNLTLFEESTEPRATAVRTQQTASIVQWVGTLTATASRVITEAGLFNADANGDLFIHGDFTGITLDTDDKIEFTFALTIQ